jgi:hypothetical protein
MSNQKPASPELADVLNEFVMAEEQPTKAVLDAWIREYPQFEDELVGFASAWIAEDILPEPPAISDEDYDLIVNRVMSHVENIMYRNEHADASAEQERQAPLDSLFQAAKDVGLGVPHFVAACRLDHLLVVKLDARQIEPRSIPATLIDLIARTLRRRADDVATFFALPPRIIPGASFKSRATPAVAGQEPFVAAVQNSSLPKAVKDYWIAESARHGPPS